MSWPPRIVDACRESDGVDLLQNQNKNVPLGPYDGEVAAHVWFADIRSFITTNAHYVPALPPGIPPNELSLRRDMRWGPDDPTVWPLEYSDYYPHFGAIPRRPSTEAGNVLLGIMFWDPDRDNFVSPQSGHTITRGLGKLSHTKMSALSTLVHQLIKQCEDYAKSLSPPARPLPLAAQLADSLRRGLTRLSSIPATYERIVIGVRNVQRAYLELAGLLRYMTVSKPRIEDPTFQGGPPDADAVGAFTDSPIVAEKLHRARLPFWLIRPLHAFSGENILRVVQPLDPAEWMELEILEGFIPIKVGPTLHERMLGLHQGTDTVPWYRNPFASGDVGKPLVSRSNVEGSSVAMSSPSSTEADGSRTKSSKPLRRISRKEPYQRSRPNKVANPNAEQERNKFEVFDSPYMAPKIPAWATALAAVDRSQPPICGLHPLNLYVFPEPALLIASQGRLQAYLHHYQLFRDALLHRMGDCDDPQDALKPQEWRDVLQGKVVKQGVRGSLAEKRSSTVQRILGPALRTCGIEQLDGLPVPPDRVPLTTETRGKEITWELAEMNFRFELCMLDARASGLHRDDECMKCFPGYLVGPHLSESKKGFAAMEPLERLPFLLCLSRLMLDWPCRPRPELLETAGELTSWGWDSHLIANLEADVARYYTQSFYHFFGRAAVVPLRLEHELEQLP